MMFGTIISLHVYSFMYVNYIMKDSIQHNLENRSDVIPTDVTSQSTQTNDNSNTLGTKSSVNTGTLLCIMCTLINMYITTLDNK